MLLPPAGLGPEPGPEPATFGCRGGGGGGGGGGRRRREEEEKKEAGLC